MKSAASLFLLAAVSLSAASAQVITFPYNYRFYGRWDRRNPSFARTVNSGSHMVVRFRGTDLSARFDTSENRAPFPTLAWRVDGGEWQEAEVAPIVKLGERLPAGEHTLLLMVRDADEHQSRWSPPLVAGVTFTGLDLHGGELLPPPPDPKLKLEFLGDSITEGVLVHPERPGKTTWPWRADGRISYAAQTAMKLGAQWRQVGFGRLGVTIPGNGGVPVSAESFNWFYEGCPRDAWQPDIVVVNQGTNDGSKSIEVFRSAYAQYLSVIRRGYPNAVILALRPFGGYHADDILAEVSARRGAGDTKIQYVDTTGWLVREDYTDGVHPNVTGDGKASDRLAAVVAAVAKAEGR